VAAAANGTSGDMPRLTNGETVQLAEYWLRASKAQGKDFGSWFNVVTKALGFFSEGDKFQIDDVHGSALFPDSLLPLVWSAAFATQAVLLDTPVPKQAPVFPATKENQAALLRRVAGEAFRLLQRKRAARGIIPLPPPVKELPKIPKELIPPGPPRLPSFGGIGTLVLIVIVAMALSKKGKR
jgi:hypothetical protein